MEKNTNQMKANEGLCIYGLLKQWSQSPLHVFQQRLKKAEDWESFIGEKEEGFDYALIEDYWPGEDVGGLTRSRASYVVVGGYMFDFFWLV